VTSVPRGFSGARDWGIITRVWCNGRGVGVVGLGGVFLRLAAGIAGAWLLAGCGNGQSPTETARLAEARRIEDEAARTPDVIDALYLGSGPLIPRDGTTECPVQGFWSGYPRGATVRLRVSTRVSAAAQDGLASAASTAGDATRGALSILVESTAEPDPQPRVNEVTVAEVLSPRSAGCPSDAGCVQYRFAGRGLLMGARVVGARGRSVGAYVHDAVGHGVLGLCHIDARQVGGAENSLMSSGLGATAGSGAATLTALDLTAIRAVYASSVNPGAGRSAFLAARLVNLQAGQLPRP
jgi:hypothetical protein